MRTHDAHVIHWMATQVHGAIMQYLHPAYRDRMNCTVRALRDALGLHLIDAYVLMREQGRVHGRGVYPGLTTRYYKDIAERRGFSYSQLSFLEAQRDYGKTIKTAQRRLCSHERVVFGVSGHVIGFSNQATSDWANNRRHHVQSAHVFKQRAA